MSPRTFLMCAALAASVVAGPVLAAPDVSGLPDFTRLVEAEGPAVVNISTSRIERTPERGLPDSMANDPFYEFFRRFAPPQMREREVNSLGSGFIISPDGYVLTNNHVVARARQITVTLTDKRVFKGRVIGADERTDVALLKIDGKNLPVAKLGKSADVKVGQWVVAIGSPFGLDNSVTSGIVSAVGRQLPDDSYVPFIQTDAAVNPGNSGGPLFNMNGEVVGINSQILSRSGGFMGISLAIPIDVALDVSSQLKAHGKVARGRIGVTMQPLTPELASAFGLAKPDGVLVVRVEKDGPSDRAGLRVGDIVTGINKQPVSNSGDLQRLVVMSKPGTRFTLQVWRERAVRQITVVSDEWVTPRDDTGADSAAAQGSDQRLAKVGLVVSELNVQQRAELGIAYGLQVRAVSGASARIGLIAGDIIVGIAGERLTSFHQLEAAIKSGKGSVALEVMRGGNPVFVALPLGPTE